jgi:putative hydrolase of the HAD superfamily
MGSHRGTAGVTARAEIRTLFTDVGGVLLTNGWDRAARQRAVAKFGLDAAELEERHHLAFDIYEIGKLALDEYLDCAVFHAPRGFSRDEFKAFMLAQSQPYPDMLDLVRRLAARHHLKVVVVSNEGRELTLHRIQQFELATFVDFFVSSCFVGLRKPDPAIFRLALDLAQASPERVAYLEDRPLFAEVATGLGIQSIHHTTCATTRAALASLGLELPA